MNNEDFLRRESMILSLVTVAFKVSMTFPEGVNVMLLPYTATPEGVELFPNGHGPLSI